MAEIKIKNLTFSYDGVYENIFENVNFSIDSDWKLGLVARNGRGKTTFLQLLMGKYEYRGTIVSNQLFQYFPINIPESRLEDMGVELMEEQFPEVEVWKVSRELHLLGMEPDVLYRPFKTLSYGERTRVMLAYLFAGEEQFLLLDEPTNHLDVESREKVKEYLKRKRGYILVSHDREFLDSCVDHIMAINRCDIEIVNGNFSSWMENRERQEQFEARQNAKIKKEIGRLEDAARQAEKWADKVEGTKHGTPRIAGNNAKNVGEQSKRMQQRRKNMEKRIEKDMEIKQGLLKNTEKSVDLKLSPLEFPKQYLYMARNLQLGYEEKEVGKPLTFEVKRGDRIAVVGRNGAGKSTLLKTLRGEILPIGGELVKAGALKISYVSQSASHLKGTLEEYAKAAEIDYTLFLTLLRKLDFDRTQYKKRMEEFSEGQKKKVEIARSLCEQAHLYIWDEPLNYIDVFSRMQIEKLIEAYQPTLLLVEHDRVFTEKVCTKVIEL